MKPALRSAAPILAACLLSIPVLPARAGDRVAVPHAAVRAAAANRMEAYASGPRHRVVRRSTGPKAATIAAGATTTAAAAATPPYSGRDDVRAFVDAMAERHGFDPQALSGVFAQVRRLPEVLRLIAPPPPTFKRSWEAYRARFLDPLRVREGLRFWREHEPALQRAEQTWRVPPEVVVAIIGVETIYGRVTGDFRVIDALSTLAFDYPRRADFFRSELEQYLLFAREAGADPFSVRGSFAGAIGLPQFMPGSIRRYATDFDGDGRIELRASPVDAIGSVARFLAEHGWVGGEPTHFDATIEDPARIAPLIEAGIEPRFTAAELAAHGVGSRDTLPAEMPLALVDLPNGERSPTYVLGARNFYVITRYNRSSFYAMAVIELARALAASR